MKSQFSNAEINNFRVLDKKKGPDGLEYWFCTYRQEYAFVAIDADSGNVAERVNGPEAIIRCRFDNAGVI